MIRLNLLRQLAGRKRPLLVAAVVLATLTVAVSTAILLRTGHPASYEPAAAGHPVMPASSSVITSSSGAATNRPRSSPAVAPAPTKSAARRGPAPSAAVTASGHSNQMLSGPSMATPVHRTQASFSPTPSRRPRPAASTHTPAPAPSPHVIGDGGLVGSVNGFRSENGINSLGHSPGLTSDAESCALQMARNSSVAHCGGNQVVAGAWSTDGCMSLFDSEQAHRDVLLSPTFSTAGSGIAVDAAGAYYCVVNFK